jgi:hypothetical protein
MPSWYDRFGQEWAKQGMVDDPTFAQADAGWAFIGQAPPTVEQFNSMFQWSDDKDNWLYGQIANVIIADGQTPSPTDLNQLLNALLNRQKKKLDADLYLYVDAVNGNNTTGKGTQVSPWKDVQFAIQYAYQNVEPAGHSIWIQLAPGTYQPFVATVPINGQIVVYGDPLNPRSYLIKATNGAAIYAVNSAVLYVAGLSVEAIGTDTDYGSSGCGIVGDRAGIVIFRDIAFGPCSNIHMLSSSGGQVFPWISAPGVQGCNYSIYGAARVHVYGSAGAVVTVVSCHCAITNNPTFTFFAVATITGTVQCWGFVYTGTTVGPKYACQYNGVINTGATSGNTLFPGTVNGIVNTGGQLTTP